MAGPAEAAKRAPSVREVINAVKWLVKPEQYQTLDMVIPCLFCAASQSSLLQQRLSLSAHSASLCGFSMLAVPSRYCCHRLCLTVCCCGSFQINTSRIRSPSTRCRPCLLALNAFTSNDLWRMQLEARLKGMIGHDGLLRAFTIATKNLPKKQSERHFPIINVC